MSDEQTPSRREARIAEAGAEIGEPALTGTLRLADAALRAPDPPGGAEDAARGRALSAYHEALTAPRPLHPDSWNAPAPGLWGRLARLVRSLRGG